MGLVPCCTPPHAACLRSVVHGGMTDDPFLAYLPACSMCCCLPVHTHTPSANPHLYSCGSTCTHAGLPDIPRTLALRLHTAPARWAPAHRARNVVAGQNNASPCRSSHALLSACCLRACQPPYIAPPRKHLHAAGCLPVLGRAAATLHFSVGLVLAVCTITPPGAAMSWLVLLIATHRCMCCTDVSWPACCVNLLVVGATKKHLLQPSCTIIHVPAHPCQYHARPPMTRDSRRFLCQHLPRPPAPHPSLHGSH